MIDIVFTVWATFWGGLGSNTMFSQMCFNVFLYPWVSLFCGRCGDRREKEREAREQERGEREQDCGASLGFPVFANTGKYYAHRKRAQRLAATMPWKAVDIMYTYGIKDVVRRFITDTHCPICLFDVHDRSRLLIIYSMVPWCADQIVCWVATHSWVRKVQMSLTALHRLPTVRWRHGLCHAMLPLRQHGEYRGLSALLTIIHATIAIVMCLALVGTTLYNMYPPVYPYCYLLLLLWFGVLIVTFLYPLYAMLEFSVQLVFCGASCKRPVAMRTTLHS